MARGTRYIHMAGQGYVSVYVSWRGARFGATAHRMHHAEQYRVARKEGRLDYVRLRLTAMPRADNTMNAVRCWVEGG